MVEISPGQPEDLEAVERIGADAFADLGDYGQLVAKFYSTQGVHSFVAREGGELVGFVLLGFLPWTGGEADGDKDWWLADLLAIAVSEQRRGRGVGRGLIERSLALVTEMTEWRDLKEIQVTCPADKPDAHAFFERFGFEVVDEQQGTYSTGQVAWRLARPLT